MEHDEHGAATVAVAIAAVANELVRRVLAATQHWPANEQRQPGPDIVQSLQPSIEQLADCPVPGSPAELVPANDRICGIAPDKFWQSYAELADHEWNVDEPTDLFPVAVNKQLLSLRVDLVLHLALELAPVLQLLLLHPAISTTVAVELEPVLPDDNDPAPAAVAVADGAGKRAWENLRTERRVVLGLQLVRLEQLESLALAAVAGADEPEQLAQNELGGDGQNLEQPRLPDQPCI